MTTYLIRKKNYDFLSHITGPIDNDDAVLRRNGFIDACKKYGAKYLIEKGDFSRESGFNACKILLKPANRPRVIFAANDWMAIGCYDYIKQINLKIPQDVGVVGFDDIFVSQYLNPPLTTVHVNIEEVGRRAAELLLKKMQTTNNIPASVVHIPTELIQGLIEEGAVIVYNRTAGPECVDELFAIYPDGRITGSVGTSNVSTQVTPQEVENLLTAISVEHKWFTDAIYSTYLNPCRQCFAHYIAVSYNGQEKSATGVDGTTAMPPDYAFALATIRPMLPSFNP